MVVCLFKMCCLTTHAVARLFMLQELRSTKQYFQLTQHILCESPWIIYYIVRSIQLTGFVKCCEYRRKYSNMQLKTTYVSR